MARRRGPKCFSERELAKVGVELTDPHRVCLTCMTCGQLWSPNLLTGGRLQKGYWKCPRGCNDPAIED